MPEKPKLLCTVKWVSGADKGKYTVGMLVDWILNFNLEEWRSENRDPEVSYIIEWRKPPKKPAKGWICYDGLIIDVSSK